MNNFIKFLFAVLCFAATVAAAQTNSPYRRVDGVIYNPSLSKLWKTIPEGSVGGGYYEKFTVIHVRTNGVIFSVTARIYGPPGWMEKSKGDVFIKNCPHKETFYTGQELGNEKFLALPIQNITFPTTDGGEITVRAFDCGEPCNLPTKKP